MKIKEKKILKGVLVDVENNEIKKVEVKDSLHSFYKLLKCDTIDIVIRNINGVNVAIVCDDDGLFKSDQIPSVLTLHNGEVVEQIVNNVLIFSADTDDDGNMLSLSDEEINQLLSKSMVFVQEHREQNILVANL